MSHVFGPVPSRRLGRSLGVDLVPHKTCSYDCIYCQLGWTTNKTVERREWVPLDAVLADVRDALDSQPDYITLSGSGEPTLYSRLGELIAGIRAMTDVPMAVLTNGSLLHLPEVRGDLMDANLIVPSLDAGRDESWRIVNKPHESLVFESMVDGLVALGREFAGEIWLEVLLLAGITATSEEVARIASIAKEIGPDRVQLNTATRPVPDQQAVMVNRTQLEELAGLFDPPAEVIADFRAIHAEHEFAAGRSAVLDLVKRRPCSLDDVAGGLGIHRNEAIKHLGELDEEGLLEKRESGGVLFYGARTVN